jgi:hypothetical protein
MFEAPCFAETILRLSSSMICPYIADFQNPYTIFFYMLWGNTRMSDGIFLEWDMLLALGNDIEIWRLI